MSVNVKNEIKFNGNPILTHMFVVESGFDMDAKLVWNCCDENWIHNYCHMRKIQRLLERDTVGCYGLMLMQPDGELWVQTDVIHAMAHGPTSFYQMNWTKLDHLMKNDRLKSAHDH